MLRILKELDKLAEDRDGARVVPFTIDVALGFRDVALGELERRGWVKLECELGLITFLPAGVLALQPLALADVLDALLSNSTPIAKGDPGWCGLSGQGYVACIGANVCAIDVADPISVQVFDEDNVLTHSWRLVIEELEV